jgi:hypothetical protein
MSKANPLWIVFIVLLAVGAALGLRFYKSRTPNSQTLAAKVADLPAAPPGLVGSLNGKSLVKEGAVPPSNSAISNTESNSKGGTESPVLDREFAAAAARPHVEVYYRQHPGLKRVAFDWNQFKAVYFAASESSNAKGYLGVFFPKSGGSGAAFTCFNVEDDAQALIKGFSFIMRPN